MAKAAVWCLGWEAWCSACEDGSGCTTKTAAQAWKKDHDARCTKPQLSLKQEVASASEGRGA